MENLPATLMVWGILYGTVSFILFMLVAWWVLLVKADQPGWAILIPFYQLYVMHKVAGNPGWWVIFWLIPLGFVQLILAIIVSFGIARNFGKGIGYTLGILILTFIFVPLLAFGDAEYEG